MLEFGNCESLLTLSLFSRGSNLTILVGITSITRAEVKISVYLIAVSGEGAESFYMLLRMFFSK